jgi:type IV pilus assembly protein PilN
MIKVNLLPVGEKKKRKQFLIIVFGVFVAGILFAVLGWFYVGRLQVESDLGDQIKRVDIESQGYSDKIAEIKDLEAKEASLDGFRKTLTGIYNVQKNVLFAFDQIASNLPGDIWITKITQGQKPDENKFIVDGYSFSNLSLQSFLNLLQKPGSGFSETALDIKSISASVGNNKQIQQFEITTRAVPQ